MPKNDNNYTPLQLPKNKYTAVEEIKKYWNKITNHVSKDLEEQKKQGNNELFFNNYDEFCNYLGLPIISNSKIKKEQLNELSRHIEFQQIQNPKKKSVKAFVITKVFPYSLLNLQGLLDYSIAFYLYVISMYPDVVNLDQSDAYCTTFDKLSKEGDENTTLLMSLCSSTHLLGNLNLKKFACSIGLFSYKYNYYCRKQNELKSFLHVPMSAIKEFYRKSNENYQRYLKDSLEHLYQSGLIMYSKRLYGKHLVENNEEEHKYKQHIEKNQFGDFVSSVINNDDVIFGPSTYLTNEEIAQYHDARKLILIFTLWDAKNTSQNTSNNNFSVVYDNDVVLNFTEDELVHSYNNHKINFVDSWIKNHLHVNIPDFSLMFYPKSHPLFMEKQNLFNKQKDEFFTAIHNSNFTINQILHKVHLSDVYYHRLNNFLVNNYHFAYVYENYDIYFTPSEMKTFVKQIPAQLQLDLLNLNDVVLDKNNDLQVFDILKLNNNQNFFNNLKNNKDDYNLKKLKELQLQNENVSEEMKKRNEHMKESLDQNYQAFQKLLVQLIQIDLNF